MNACRGMCTTGIVVDHRAAQQSLRDTSNAEEIGAKFSTLSRV